VRIKNLKQWLIIILILSWLGWHLAHPVYLTRSDLGRHIKNGELILHGNWDVLYKNFYSYTNPEYPFINHHWLFGVWCYVLWHYFGFTGLSFIYLILKLFTFYVFFRCWRRYYSFPLVCAFALLSLPLISLRYDIRPEGISYLFCGLFWWMIDCFQQKRLKAHHLIIGSCALQIIWVNTHIFFIIGPILTAIFWWQARINREERQAGVLKKLFWLLLGMCLINPSGIYGFLTPFHIDKAYSIPIIENGSILYFLQQKTFIYTSFFIYFLITLSMLIVPLFFLIKREGLKKHIFIGLWTLLISLAAIMGIRMIGLYGFFWMPLSSYVFSKWIETGSIKFRKNITTILLILGVLISASVNFDWKQWPGFGVLPGSNDAAEFFKREKISGVIFNDYEIGGYLIFHLCPQHKLFVDDRMEAYPQDFFKRTYVPMQWNDDLWRKMDEYYHFNVIFIRQEQNAWAIRFLADRLMDRHHWALVFWSDEAAVLLKRNAQNADIIRRNEIFLHVNVKLSWPKDIPYPS